MKHRLFFAVAILCSLLGFGCAHTSGNKGQQVESASLEKNVSEALQALQAKYAPEPHLSIFRISPEPAGDMLILRGEVDNPAAKTELLETFQKLGVRAVDRVTVLPAENLGEKTWGIVRLSVANMREGRDNAAELGTQVLMGHVVRLWKNQGGWYYVQSSDRYLGWMEDDGFVPVTKEQVNAWNSAERVIVTEFYDRIWQNPGGKVRGNVPVTDVVAGNLLKKVGEESEWLKVELPDGRSGYLSKNSAMDFQQWKSSRQPTAENIEETAKWLMGVPYLWGGTSIKAVDCSGFTKTVYFLNGIQLLRNASHQAKQGTDVPIDPEFKNLRKGDLLFFGSKASSRRPERVTHVGIYLGNKQFIHSSGLVRINSLDRNSPILDKRRLETLIRVRRYLPES